MKEIKSQDWNAFCERMNKNERGATVDILWIDRETKAERPIAQRASFEEITFGQRDGCNDQFLVRTGGEAETRHEIIEPIHVLLRAGGSGNFNGVAIEAEEGTTIMTFQPGLRADWLNGL